MREKVSTQVSKNDSARTRLRQGCRSKKEQAKCACHSIRVIQDGAEARRPWEPVTQTQAINRGSG